MNALADSAAKSAGPQASSAPRVWPKAKLAVLCGHHVGLTPLSPGSLADGLLLLFRLYAIFKVITPFQFIERKRADSHFHPKTGVDPVGFEPTAFSMPLRRAPNCAMGPFYLQKGRDFFPAYMDLVGFEPTTSSVRLKRAPNCATGPDSGCRNCTRGHDGCQAPPLGSIYREGSLGLWDPVRV